MPKVSVQIAINVEGHTPISGGFEETVEHSQEPGGMESFIQEGLLALKVELLYAQFYNELPDARDLFPEVKSRTFSSQDLINGKIETENNKQALWRLVGNLALAVKVLLAKAKALNELHRAADPADERLHFLLLLEKLEKLNLAVHTIATMRDLHMRIINESVGGVPFTITLKSGKKVLARTLSKLLEHRHERSEIANLDQHQLEILEEIGKKLERSATSSTKAFLKYRNQLVHQEPQSVDDARLFPKIESREWTPFERAGKVVGGTKGISLGAGEPDWHFEDLLRVVVEAFEHYLSTLRLLRALEAFNPD